MVEIAVGPRAEGAACRPLKQGGHRTAHGGSKQVLPAPEGQFALIIRAQVPEQPILDDSYRFPDVSRE